MTAIKAIKTFLETGKNGMPVSSRELMAFRKCCTDAEWYSMALDACEELGVTLTEKKAA